MGKSTEPLKTRQYVTAETLTLFSGLDSSALLCLSLCTSVGGKPQPKGTRGYDVVNYIYRAATCCHKNQ